VTVESREVQRLYSLSIDDLYEALGRSAVSPEFGKLPPTKQLAIDRGQAFLAAQKEKLRTKICVEWHYCSRRSGYTDFQSLAYAIAPLVSSVAGVPVTTAMIVAILLIRIGLDDFCHCPST
jgi:hypothetical protein